MKKTILWAVIFIIGMSLPACGFKQEEQLNAISEAENKIVSNAEEYSSCETNELMVWIPTKGGIKYHSRSSCSNMKEPDYVTISEAEKRGFDPCNKCYK